MTHGRPPHVHRESATDVIRTAGMRRSSYLAKAATSPRVVGVSNEAFVELRAASFMQEVRACAALPGHMSVPVAERRLARAAPLRSVEVRHVPCAQDGRS